MLTVTFLSRVVVLLFVVQFKALGQDDSVQKRNSVDQSAQVGRDDYAVSFDVTVEIEKKSSRPVQDDQCSVYLAVVRLPWSAISIEPEETDESDNEETVLDLLGRWALFAGRSFQTDELLDLPADISLPLISFGSTHVDRFEEGSTYRDVAEACVSILYEYLWGGQHDSSYFDPKYSGKNENGDTLTLIPGVGLMSTTESSPHSSFNTLLRRTVRFDVPSVHRRVLPPTSNGIMAKIQEGAYSIYFNMTVAVGDPDGLLPGTELILPNMYDRDQEEEEEEDDPKNVLNEKDFENLNNFLQKLKNVLFDETSNEPLTREQQQVAYDYLRGVYLEAALGKSRAEYVAEHLLPPDLESLEKLFIHDELIEDSTEQQESPLFYGQRHSIKWLEQNAYCVDTQHTLRTAMSTIPEAGHGAFATRRYRAKQLILVVPLLPIPDRGFLDFIDENDGTLQQQLLLNYCYGHPESDALLFPVAPGANLINHQDGDKVNVKLQWSTDPRLMENHAVLEQMDPHSLLLDMYRPRGNPSGNAGFPAVGGMVMEIVAARDIDPGEELFLDYGSEWAAAWQAHVDAVTAEGAEENDHDKQDLSAEALHLNYKYHENGDMPFPIYNEQESVFPPNVQLKAFIPDDRFRRSMLFEDVRTVVSILSRHPMSKFKYSYNLRVENPAFDHLEPDSGEEEFITKIAVPHTDLFFVPATTAPPEETETNIRSSNPFRHYISIADDIFPRGRWRNRKQEN